MTKLLIKYENKYLCGQNNNKIDFIHIPIYHPEGTSFSNISVFITLIANGYLRHDFGSKKSLTHKEWESLFEQYFIPEYLTEVDEEIYVYDIDEMLAIYPEYGEQYKNSFQKLPENIVIKSPEELNNKSLEEFLNNPEPNEDELFTWDFHTTHVDKDLERFISKKISKRSDKDVLLMYSGGKDSTLSAIRLHNAGYNVHFIHFDNGNMRDTDKPYLTFKRIFEGKEGFYFDYELSSVNIKNLFWIYYSNAENFLRNKVDKDDPELTSEIRCLSCRMAMYTALIKIAKDKGFKLIAEGARISQKFMLEQLPIIERLKKLASDNDLELLLPVLNLEDDQKEIEELLANGYSSKTWESKCLIGQPAKDKTPEDENVIIEYYEKELIPKVLKKTTQGFIDYNYFL